MKYIPNRFDDYFASKGILVRSNCLGFTEETVHSYIKESYDIVKLSNKRSSNYSKNIFYNKFFSLEERFKKTGFESLSKIDQNYRHTYRSNEQISDRWDYPDFSYEIFKNDGESYLDNLKRDISTIQNPMIFYSGGIDSEFLLTTFIDTNLSFKVVIFELKDLLGNNINQYDLDHAFKFCKENHITPIIKSICPEKIWQNNDFVQLSKDLKLTSPQLTTHAYMIYIMSDEYPNYSYCLAGEIRYHLTTNIPKKNIVRFNSAKQPLTLKNYEGDTPRRRGTCQLRHYFNAIGQWSFSSTHDFFYINGVTSSVEDSGTWTNTPTRSYNHQFQTVYINPIYNSDPLSGTGSVYVHPSFVWINNGTSNEGFKFYTQSVINGDTFIKIDLIYYWTIWTYNFGASVNDNSTIYTSHDYYRD